MTKVDDLNVIEDIFPLFNYTLNDDAKYRVKEILSSPLSSLAEINTRQNILKSLIHSGITSIYSYQKTDYKEVSYFLNILDPKNFKNVDYLTYLFQKTTNNRLIGHYIQLAYFFKELEKVFKEYINIKDFPEPYQQDLSFILNYINSFQYKKFGKQISKGKLKYSAVQFLNKLILEKRLNGGTAKFYDLLNQFEAYVSIVTSIQKTGFVFPEFDNDKFEIIQMYHPLLKEPVKSDFEDDASVVLLTGANMSGKSTFLKSLSLVVYLAHLGVAVPAKRVRLPFYDYISIYINHSDDIKNGLSHFMQEIINVKHVLESLKYGMKCFAVFDELYKGTNYQDALKISSITINGLEQFAESKFFISTHIYELKDSISENSNISAYHLDCIIVDNYPQFTYRLKEGWTNLKIGELLFEREGMKELLKLA